MLPDRVSNPGPLTYESGALPIALRGPASDTESISPFSLSLYIAAMTVYQPWPIKISGMTHFYRTSLFPYNY